jgi:hypothetical protein
VIQSPRILSEYDWWTIPRTYLSKSRKGVYYTATDYFKFQVWVLNEEPEASHGLLPVWEMVHHADLEPSMSLKNPEDMDKSWILDHVNALETKQGYREWDSDDDHEDNVAVKMMEEEQGGGEDIRYLLDLLGYHPEKEIAFLGSRYRGSGCAYAYYLGTSKLEYLGDLYPKRGEWITSRPKVRELYVYTPCRIDMLHDWNGTSIDLSYWLQ